MARSTKSREPAPVAATDAPAVAPAKAKKPKQTRPCGCGCGVQVTRRFLPGHDGRLKGRLLGQVKAARVLGDADAESTAAAELTKLGWAKFIPAS